MDARLCDLAAAAGRPLVGPAHSWRVVVLHLHQLIPSFSLCSSFSSNHPGSALSETVPCARAGGPTVVGPDACVQGSWGAALRRGLVSHESDVVVHYGFEPNSASRECAAKAAPRPDGAGGAVIKPTALARPRQSRFSATGAETSRAYSMQLASLV